MNINTGEIRDVDKAMLMDLMNPKQKLEWFAIDKRPDDGCHACEGHGYIGRFLNGKVIPCACVYDTQTKWCKAVNILRSMKKRDRMPEIGLESDNG